MPALHSELLALITLASIQSILQAAATAGAGVILGARGMLKPEMTKGLALISTKVAIPCLLFTKMLRTVRLELVAHAWPMIIMPFVVVTIACAVGYATVLIVKPPRKLRGTLIAAVGFGNSTSMPILLLSIITETLQEWWLRANHVRSLPRDAADPVVYVGIYGVTYPMLTWGVATWLLQTEEPRQLEAGLDPRLDAGAWPCAAAPSHAPPAARNSSLHDMSVHTAALPPSDDSSDNKSDSNSVYTALAEPLLHASGGGGGGAGRLAASRLSAACRFIRARVLLPPTVGVLLGLCCAASPHLHFAFCGGEVGEP